MRFAAWILAVIVSLSGCKDTPRTCDPGSTQTCVCASGTGAQSCKEDGSGWNTCVCADNKQSAKDGSASNTSSSSHTTSQKNIPEPADQSEPRQNSTNHSDSNDENIPDDGEKEKNAKLIAAADAYRAIQTAYNKGDAEAYFAGFTSQICFYNSSDYTRERLQKKRRPGRVVLRFAVEPLHVENNEVLLWDTGSYAKPGDERRPHNKIILMRLSDGVWSIAAEGGYKYACVKPLMPRLTTQQQERIKEHTDAGIEKRKQIADRIQRELDASLEKEDITIEDSGMMITLQWFNNNDLDIWVETPSGERISYRNPKARNGGALEVDFNVTDMNTSNVRPMEVVGWRPGKAQKGVYRVYVHLYSNRGGRDPSQYYIGVHMPGATKRKAGTDIEESRWLFKKGYAMTGQPAQLVWMFEY
jgi:hypothetical protein